MPVLLRSQLHQNPNRLRHLKLVKLKPVSLRLVNLKLKSQKLESQEIPKLAKEIGFKIEDQPLTFTTAAGKVFTPGNGRVADKGKLVEDRSVKSNGMTLIHDVGQLRLCQERLY
ncbi:hypothetical protein H8356DRAFT_1081587 [Neocallimastix lanati (nom. inval.)]|nr:hypothetical protein H8356DRAFT_1081587 [Neocallimastix sp. JGI-2020a]